MHYCSFSKGILQLAGCLEHYVKWYTVAVPALYDISAYIGFGVRQCLCSIDTTSLGQRRHVTLRVQN